VDAYYESMRMISNAEPEVRIQQIRLIIPPSRVQGRSAGFRRRRNPSWQNQGVKTSPHWSASIPGIPPPRREETWDIQARELLPAIDEYAFSMSRVR